jgi:hypothetical protein
MLVSTTVILAQIKEDQLEIYLSFFVVEFFACSFIHPPRNSFYNYLCAGLFVAWIILVAQGIFHFSL